MLATVPSTWAAAGPYTVLSKTFTYSALDETDQHIDVLYPSANFSGQQFPLISYAHGFDDAGGDQFYAQLGTDLASWGYVVAFPNSCTYGCLHDCVSLSGDPPCFGHYYLEQLKTIEFFSTTAAAGVPVNTSAVAVAGHSMGGQASLFSASNASAIGAHRIKAAALHHAFTHEYPAALVPFLAFTGTLDFTAPPAMAQSIFDASGASSTRGLVNKRGVDHHEPSTHYNPALALFTVAWFKLHVDGVASSEGMAWDELIYGTGGDSLCGGGDGEMQQCSVLGRERHGERDLRSDLEGDAPPAAGDGLVEMPRLEGKVYT